MGLSSRIMDPAGSLTPGRPAGSPFRGRFPAEKRKPGDDDVNGPIPSKR